MSGYLHLNIVEPHTFTLKRELIQNFVLLVRIEINLFSTFSFYKSLQTDFFKNRYVVTNVLECV